MRRARATGDTAEDGAPLQPHTAERATGPHGAGFDGELPDWLSAAGRPGFEELRNVMLLLGMRLSNVQRAVAEMAPPMGQVFPDELDDERLHAAGAMDDLAEALRDIENGLELARSTLGSLEELVITSRRGARLTELLKIADALAQHHTRPIGGLHWRLPEGDPHLAMSRAVAIGVLSNTLSVLGLRAASAAPGTPIEVAATLVDDVCTLAFGCALQNAAVQDCATALAQMFVDVPVAVAVRGASLVLELPLR